MAIYRDTIYNNLQRNDQVRYIGKINRHTQAIKGELGEVWSLGNPWGRVNVDFPSKSFYGLDPFMLERIPEHREW